MDAVSQQDTATAQVVYDGLMPAKDTLVRVASDRVRGQLARLLGDTDNAIEHFEDALKFTRDNGLRPELAWTCSDYAELLIERDADGDAGRVTELQDEAIAIAQDLGMRPLLERVLAQREILKA
ncbi:MAG: hypothetical protein IH868_07670 [Chloroflexi bacterium]|nr:hypothetical protein [Chloroflexota bacterium]